MAQGQRNTLPNGAYMNNYPSNTRCRCQQGPMVFSDGDARSFSEKLPPRCLRCGKAS